MQFMFHFVLLVPQFSLSINVYFISALLHESHLTAISSVEGSLLVDLLYGIIFLLQQFQYILLFLNIFRVLLFLHVEFVLPVLQISRLVSLKCLISAMNKVYSTI